MGFDRDYFSQMAYGGKGGNSLWHYFDVNADNVASTGENPSPNTTYFSRAYTDNGIVARAGDIIFVASRSDASLTKNSATPVVFMVPTTWDANGASVIQVTMTRL